MFRVCSEIIIFRKWIVTLWSAWLNEYLVNFNILNRKIVYKNTVKDTVINLYIGMVVWKTATLIIGYTDKVLIIEGCMLSSYMRVMSELIAVSYTHLVV